MCKCIFPENVVFKAATEHYFLYNLSLMGHCKFLLKDVFLLFLFMFMKVLTVFVEISQVLSCKIPKTHHSR